MLRLRRLLLTIVIGLVALVVLSAGTSQARESFKIAPALQLTNPDAAKAYGIHEALITLAIDAVTPGMGTRAVNLIQAGAVNSDLTHQWDDEFHFDNIVTDQDLFLAIAHTQRELADAVKHAREGGSSTVPTALSDQFTSPSFQSFQDLYINVERTLMGLLKDPECTAARGVRRRRSRVS